MKTKLVILLVLTASVMWAAQLIVDIPQNDVQRVSRAFGTYLTLGRPATMQEVSEATRIQWVMAMTYRIERDTSNKAYVQPPLEMQPTPTPTSTATVTATATATSTPTSTATPEAPSPTETPTPTATP